MVDGLSLFSVPVIRPCLDKPIDERLSPELFGPIDLFEMATDLLWELCRQVLGITRLDAIAE